MRRFIFLVFVCMCILLPLALQAADWPQFLGPNADGFSSEKGIDKDWSKNPPKQLWSLPMMDDGYAGPSVANGIVFIINHIDNKDVVTAINLKNGMPAWEYSYDDTDKANYGFARSTPTVNEGKVYTYSRLGVINCLDAKTGKKIWTRDIFKDFDGKRPQWDYAMSTVIDGNKLIACPGGANASVVALDKKTGKNIWKGGSESVSYATPAIVTIGRKRQYVVAGGESIFSIDAKSGAQLWSVPWKTKHNINGAVPKVIGNKLFISSGYGHGSCLIEVSGDSAKIVWENADLQARFSTPLLVNGFIYGTEDSGSLVCMNPTDGKVLWKQKGFEHGGSVCIDGVILVFDGKGGDLVMVKPSPEKYEELGRFTPLGGQSWTAPIISNGKLIIRNKTTLACYNLIK